MRISRSRSIPAALCLGGLLLLSGGCGDDRMSAELASALYASPLSVPVARELDAGALPAGAAAREIDASRRVFAVGARDGDERYVFGKVAGLAVSASGDTVFVLDALQRRVKVFGPDGRFLRQFGGRGKGPGEYEAPAGIAAVPWNGGVAVWDDALQRVTVLSAAGEVLHTGHPLRQTDIARQGKKLRTFAGGFVLETRSDPFTTPPERQRGYLVRLDTAGAVVDTLVDFAIPSVAGSTQQGNDGLVSWTTLWSPTWTPDPQWDVSAGGEAVIAPGGRYEIYRLGADRSALRIGRPWTPERITRRERLANVHDARERGLMGKSVPVFVQELTQRKFFAVVRPSLTGVLVDEGGQVWARRFDVADHPQGLSRTWDLYAPDGAPAGPVRFAPGFVPLAVQGGRVYGVRRDALDVDRLEAYRL